MTWLRRWLEGRTVPAAAERIVREAVHTGTWRGYSGVWIEVRWDSAIGRWFRRWGYFGQTWAPWEWVGQERLRGYVESLERGGFEPDRGWVTAEVRGRIFRKLGNLP